MDISDFLKYLGSHPTTRNLGSTLANIVDEQRRIAESAHRRAPRRRAC